MVIYFQLIGYIVLSALNDNNFNGNRLRVNGNNFDNNDNSYAFGMAYPAKTLIMITYNNLYKEVYGWKNLYEAYREARKGKTK